MNAIENRKVTGSFTIVFAHAVASHWDNLDKVYKLESNGIPKEDTLLSVKPFPPCLYITNIHTERVQVTNKEERAS